MKKMLIGNQWVGASDGRTLDVVSPSDGKAFDQIARGTPQDVNSAVAAARAALQGPWGQLNATERGRIMTRIGLAVLDHEEELAQLEARDTGKPLTTARNDIKVLARYFEFYAGGADKLHGETIPFLNGHQVSLLREPLGVTAHIIPWNYPAQMLGRTLAGNGQRHRAQAGRRHQLVCTSLCRIGTGSGLACWGAEHRDRPGRGSRRCVGRAPRH